MTQVAALPEARLNAVIPGLQHYTVSSVPTAMTWAYRLRADAPLYTGPAGRPVARLAAKNFLGEPTVVVLVTFSGTWA